MGDGTWETKSLDHSIIITAHTHKYHLWHSMVLYTVGGGLSSSGLPAAHIIAASSHSDKEEAEDHQRAEYQE